MRDKQIGNTDMFPRTVAREATPLFSMQLFRRRASVELRSLSCGAAIAARRAPFHPLPEEVAVGAARRLLIGSVAIGVLELASPARAAGPEPQRDDETMAREVQRFTLQKQRDGSYLYRGSAFDARIATDGAVRFSDHGPIRLIQDPGPDRAKAPMPGRDPITTTDISESVPSVRPTNDIVVVEERPGVHFDLTDEYLHSLGKDPARPQKTAFLAATFDLRTNLALESRRHATRMALDDLPARLDNIWRDPRLTPAERLHVLQALWSELGEGPDADAARATIQRFAREHLTASEAAGFQK
jgi:hypothetical protein